MPRRALLALLALAGAPLPGAAADPLLPVRTEVVAIVDDDLGAGQVTATCTAYADPVAAASTTVYCATEHRDAALGAPGAVAAATVRATEPSPYLVCAWAYVAYRDGTATTTPKNCQAPIVTVSRGDDGCRAYADPPRAPHNFYIEAVGGIACGEPGPLRATVCLDVLDGSGWVPHVCASAGGDALVRYVEASVIGCHLGLSVVRSSVTATDGSGRVERAESEPVAFFCIPLRAR